MTTNSLGIQEGIFKEVVAERKHQDEKYGLCPREDYSDLRWLAVVAGELGEAADRLNRILLGQTSNEAQLLLDHEILQVATSAIAWLEDRRLKGVCGKNLVAEQIEELLGKAVGNYALWNEGKCNE